MLDDRVRVRARPPTRSEDRAGARGGCPAQSAAPARYAPTTGRFLLALAASQVRLRGAGDRRRRAATRRSGSRAGARASSAATSTSLEHDPAKCEAWRGNDRRGGARRSGQSSSRATRSPRSRALDDVVDVVFLDAEKDDYEALFALARTLRRAGWASIVADNVLSHADALGAYSRARQADPALSSVTVPLDRGLELTVVL